MLKSAVLFTFGRLVYAGSQWLVMVYLARFVSIDLFGTYTFSLALCAPIIMFSQMNMRTFLITDTTSKFSINEYVSTRIYIALFSLILILIYAYYYFDTGILKIVSAVAMYKTLESIIDIFCAIFQKNNLIKLIAISNILRGLSLVGSVTYIMFLGYSIEIALFVVVLMWFFFLVSHDFWYVNKYEKIHLIFNIKKMLEIVKSCLPLGIVMSLLTLVFSLPVYFIKYYHGVSFVGVYSAIVYFLLVGRLITDSLIQTSLSRMAFLYNEAKYKELRGIIVKLLMINIFIGFVFYYIALQYGENVLGLLYGENFSKYHKVLEVVVLAAILNYISQIFGVIITIKRRLYRMVVIHSIQVIAIFISCVLFVKPYGVIGGAYSLLIGFIVILILNISLLLIDGDIKKIIMAS